MLRRSRDDGGGAAVRSLLLPLAIALLWMAEPAPATAEQQPNIIVVVTDDQTTTTLNPRVMPNTIRLLARRGTAFSQAVVATPQCCPSRASLLTGQYPHNHGVISNDPGYELLRNQRNTLPAWLRRAGYLTVHIGKYLNGYARTHRFRPAPGWSRWQTLTAAEYRRPRFSIDGKLRAYRGRHLTGILTRMAGRSIRRHAGSGRPLYLQVDHLAPHVGGRHDRSGTCAAAPMPAPRDSQRFAAARLPRPPSFDEPDSADKPPFIGRLPRLGAEGVRELTRQYRCTLASLRGVDRGVARLVRELRRAGELRRTAIVFTSDNGNAFGEHRVPLTKGLPYEEHLRVPLLIRPPAWFPRRARTGRRLQAPVSNVDLAPTILGLARAEPCLGERRCRTMDGRSLLGLMRGGRPGWASWRAIRTGFDVNIPSYPLSCAWEGLRTTEEMLARHTLIPAPETNVCEPANELELYDLRADPFQLANLLAGDPGPEPAARRDRLLGRLDALRDCAGIPGRDPDPAPAAYCE